MRYVRFSLIALIWISLSSSSLVFAQNPWSGILSNSRATDWSGAGLPATLPDGETTANPWTPPVRTQCGSTLSSSATVHDINVALASCPAGTYIQLPGTNTSPVTYNFGTSAGCYAGSDTCIQMYNANGVTLRGGGPEATIIHLSGWGKIQFGVTWNNGIATISSGLSAGSTSISVPSISAAGGLVVGQLAYINQCDTGYSGSSCTGTSVDNGSIYVCGDNTACQAGVNSGPQQHQIQMVRVTGISGGGPYTVTFSPAIRMTNWSTSQTATLNWSSSTSGGGVAEPYGNGLEDLTVYDTGSSENMAVDFSRTYASWIKGVRVIGAGLYAGVYIASTKNVLLFNNYFFADPQIDANYPPPVQEAGSADNLILNNISASGVPWEGMGGNEGDVYAYNYNRDTFVAYVEDVPFDHAAYSSFDLFEGNQTAGFADDDTWGTHGFNTFFRNYLPCWDPPYNSAVNARGLVIDNYHRFDNAVGNTIGTAGVCTTYQSANNYSIFRIGSGDALAGATFMRWGNVSPIGQADDSPANSGVRFLGSEVPASLLSANLVFSNPVPASTSLPASFYMNLGAHPNGGTGLSWWKVCTNWSSFPTSCAGYDTQPFPIAGPDLSGGSYVNGHAYDIPAEVAWKNLPIDSSFQTSYSITGSSWSGGIETLTISGLPNPTHLMGGFQLSGVSSACNPTSGELLMTGSSTATISYALTSNPGVSCTGTFKFPDIRQFDERVYQQDAGQVSSQPGTPSGLVGSVVVVQ